MIALFSGRRISARFAAGYFFYWNAWSLLGAPVGLVLVLVGWLVPLFETQVPELADKAIGFVSFFMFIDFPLLFWPRIIGISWQRTAVALLGGLAAWIAIMAVLAPMIVDVPEF